MFFVVGVGRSGTTLLRALLNSHPLVAIPPESHFIPTLLRRRNEFESESGVQIDSLMDYLSQNRAFLKWGLDFDAVRCGIANTTSIEDSIRSLFRTYASQEGKSVFGDKTPSYVMSIPLLADGFPESRFIHIIRDGRDVALSLMDVAEWGPSSVEQCALFWKTRMERGRRHGRRLGNQRYIEVRYESLVENPVRTCEGICRYLGLDFEEVMLTYPKSADQLLTVTLDPHTHTRLRLPPISGLRDFRSQMNTQDRTLFDAIAGKTLRAFGYEVNRKIPLSTQARAKALRVAHLRSRVSEKVVRTLRMK